MRARTHSVLSVWPAALLMTAISLAGCGDTGSGGEYRDYREVRSTKSEQLPVITPGEPSGSEVAGSGGGTRQDSRSGADAAEPVPESEPTPVPAVSPPPASEDPAVANAGIPEDRSQDLQAETGKRVVAQAAKREVRLLVPTRSFQTDRETRSLRVSYDDLDLLKILNMEPVPADAAEHFPDWLRSLDGKQVRIRGYMYPTYQATGLTGFLIARDNGICCFVRQPKVYDIMSVRLAEGETTDYIEGRPFDVVGIFHIDPLIEDDELLQLYRIDDARVVDH